MFADPLSQANPTGVGNHMKDDDDDDDGEDDSLCCQLPGQTKLKSLQPNLHRHV